MSKSDCIQHCICPVPLLTAIANPDSVPLRNYVPMRNCTASYDRPGNVHLVLLHVQTRDEMPQALSGNANQYNHC